MKRLDGMTERRPSASAFMTTAILERIRSHDRPVPSGPDTIEMLLITNIQPDVWEVYDSESCCVGEVHEVNGRYETFDADGGRGYTFDSLRRAAGYLDDYAYVCRQWL